ncbi:MAG: hypothetical protein KAH93_04380 [Candidatus Aenigmarchaeota archaeon]|nr:hypothetical protein [Candidatus Aenigmarchaeota archaeon]
MKNIDLDRTLFIPTKSRYDLSIEEWGSESAARERFISKQKWVNVYKGNQRQKENLRKIKNRFPAEKIIDRSELTPEIIKDHDLFVSLGGDDHLMYCGQCVLQYMKENPEEKKYIAGVVLDPVLSSGNVLYFKDVDRFLADFEIFENGDYLVEKWTSLEAKVQNGEGVVEPYPTVSTLYIGEYASFLMSRCDAFDGNMELFVEYKGHKIPFPEKTSGILVATGIGSGDGSWYDNIYGSYFDRSDEFGRENNIARVVGRENKKRPLFTLNEEEILVVHSYNDNRGIVIPDSHEDHSVDFDMGSIAEVWISKLKLPVVKPR